jgi:class 3 adenylate cyclase
MTQLKEAFNDPSCRSDQIVMFIDMTDSTAMKASTPEVNWLPTFGWFFDAVSDVVERCSGRIVKFLGDGVMVVFSPDDGAAAINAAVLVQELLGKARAEKQYDCNCSVGIAVGKVVHFTVGAGGAEDYIGTVVDRSARLCSGANAGSVFVDSSTVNAANMYHVQSRIGAALNRTPEEYVGAIQELPAKGFHNPIRYYEIIWDHSPHGVKTSTVSELARSEGTARSIASPTPPRPIPDRQSAWLAGRVQRWHVDRGIGFIVSGEEEFYFDSRFVVDSRSMAVGDQVFFIPRDPLVTGRNRVAAVIIAMGQRLNVRVGHINTRGFGFAELSDGRGNAESLFLSLGIDTARALRLGQEVDVVVAVNARGPIGQVSMAVHGTTVPPRPTPPNPPSIAEGM